MKAVILAAGRGTRMGNMCDDVPKPMISLDGIPKLVYTMSLLPEEITEVIFVVGYLAQHIQEYFGKCYENRVITYVKQEKLDGTGGAMLLVRKYVSDEKFLVLMGDDLYCKDDLKKLITYDYALLAYKTRYAEEFGLVDVDAEGCLLDVVERPHTRDEGLVNTAAYTLSPGYFDYDPVSISETEYGLPQTLVAGRTHHKTHIVTTECWQPMGCPEDVNRAKQWLKKQQVQV